MKRKSKKFYASSAIVVSLLMSSCAKESSDSDLTTTSEVLSALTEGYSVPQSISAIPAENTAQASASSSMGITRSLRTLSAKSINRQASAATTDFDAAGDLELKISEPALDQFSIIETIMATLKQTNYWDAKVINKGAYKSLVKWEESEGFEYQYWTINSKMIVVNGKDVNRVRFWIEGDEQISGMMDIFSAPTGSNSYGEWRLDVTMTNEGVSGSFAAASEKQADGTIKLSIDDNTKGASNGVLYLDNGSGKGIVQYPDWDSCQSQDCDPSSITAKMSYNENHAIIQKDSNQARCKDRASFSDIYMDYKLYNAAGTDVNKVKSYSFPLKYNGQYYYYGGWNGRQQLWGEGAKDLALNTELDHADQDNSSSYTIDSRVKGILTKKSGTQVDLTDNTTISNGVGNDTLQGSDWSNSLHFMLLYSGGAWKYCDEFSFNWSEKTCSSEISLGSGNASAIANTDAIFTAHNSNNIRVQVTDFDDRKWSNVIDGKADAASFSSALDTSKIYRVSYEKMIYLKYDGTTDNRWETCTADFSSDPWNPTLSSCVAHDWNNLAESWGKFARHFWTNGGTQYLAQIDKSTGGGGSGNLLSLVKIKEEVVKAAVSGALTGRNYDGSTTGKTYTFDSTLQLTDDSDSSLVTSRTEKLFDDAGNEYQWEYSENGDWDVMTYLAYGANPPAGKSQGDLVVFDDALKFSSIAAKNVSGDSVTLTNLVFDGWLSGLPDVWRMLQENRQNDSESGLSPTQKAKIVNIPTGTSIVDSLGDTYKVKPRYGLRILNDIDSGSCTVSIDETVSLSDGITYKVQDVGSDPNIADVTVIEGVFIDD